jgi:hypothetical protein
MGPESEPTPQPGDADGGLPPPGRRWGAGAQSVLPYLTKSLQAKPASPADGEPRRREGNPVFANWPPRAG